MHVGVHTPPLYDRSLPEAVEYLAGLGVAAIEPGVGGHPGDDHLPTGEYLGDADRQAELSALLDSFDVSVSALATHNNPLHPDPDRAARADDVLRRAIRLAAQLDVGTVTCFSGLPGGADDDSTPNWITAPWPPEHAAALDYQWSMATEYWDDLAGFADDHGVDIAIEMHPNMLIHAPAGLIRLRHATNDRIGANFDPSHLYWQGIDVMDAIRVIGELDAIHHVHAKDTALYPANARTKGVLDTTPYDEPAGRTWLFRTVGYGHGEAHWKELVSTLRLVGYDGALSIEHEDALTSALEGLEKAVSFLRQVVFETAPDGALWAG